MTTITDGQFNADPYFDDFDETKNFMQLLFAPGRALQARELTQSQSIILNQLKDLSSHLFTDGTPVINGKINLNRNQRWILIDTADMNVDVKGQMIIGQSSGARAYVEYVHVDSANEPYLYIKEVGGTFYEGEEIQTEGFGDPEISMTIQGTPGTTSVYEGSFGGMALFASNDAGIYYIDGKMVPVDAQTVMVDKSSSLTNNTIGFSVIREIITSADDSTLLDPAHGFYNYNAPGADRYRITLELNTKSDHEVKYPDADFVDLMTLVDGNIAASVDRTYNAVLEETLARRTFNESGDYTVKNFTLALTNTSPEHTVTDDEFVVKLDPGKAYVQGYEIETVGPTYIKANKTREFERKNNGALLLSIGPYVELKYDVDPNTLLKTYNDKWGFDVSRQEFIEFLDSNGDVLFDTRVKYLIGNKMYLCSSCDELTQMRSVKSVRSKTYPSDRVANLVLTDGVAVLKGTERKPYPSILEMPERNIKTVINNEAHFTTQKVFRQINVSSNSITFTTGSSNLTFSSISQIIDNTTNNVIDPDRYSGNNITGIGTDILSVRFNSLTGSVTVFAVVNVTQSSYITKTLTIHSESVGATNNIITLGKTDVYDVTSVVGSTLGNVTSDFRVNNGQLDHIYGYGKLTYTGSADISAETFTVTYRYFVHGNNGEYFSVDSYTNAYDNTVPGFTDLPVPYENDALRYVTEAGTSTLYLRNVLDFRVNALNVDTTDRMVPLNDTVVYADYDYYLPRIDKVVLDNEGLFSVVEGVPDMDPIEPNTPKNAMVLYKLFVPAYMFTLASIGIETIDNKRYTMRDIGKLDARLTKEEYYTSLSLLEQSAIDMTITDENGLNRYKNGILVDNFTGHGVGDVEHEEYNISIDPSSGTLRMPFTQKIIEFKEATDGSAVNTRWNANTITLDYTSTMFIEQLECSQVMNVNPYNVFSWGGDLELVPNTDNWIDTDRNPDVLVNFDGNNDAFNGPSPWTTTWNSWETNVLGFRTTTSIVNEVNLNNLREIEITTNIIDTQQARTGTQTRTVPSTITRDIGDRVVDVSVIPFMRARNVVYTATGMKPNTTLHAIFDDVNVDAFVDTLATDANGACTGTFRIPASTFRTGERTFKLVDNENAPTTFAEGKFTASGLLQTKERTIASVTSLETEVRSVSETGTRSSTVLSTTGRVLRTVRWQDPLAQSFLVDGMEGGVFLSSIDVFFKSKDDTLPVTIEVREMVNGYPGQIIIPFSKVSMNPGDVVTTGNENTAVNATTFTFSDPVYLQNNMEYCFVILSNSNKYEVYTAKIGDKLLKTDGSLGNRISKQPYAGVMFKSQNGSTWTADQNMDITFRINRAKFTQGSGVISLFNEDWDDTAPDGSDHIKITTMMPTIEYMSGLNASINWEILFKEGANEINASWIPFENLSNIAFNNQIILDGSPLSSDPVQVKLRGKINTTSDNLSPMVNFSRIGVIGVANTGSEAYKCTIEINGVGGVGQPDLGTQAECIAAGGTWEDDSVNYEIVGNYVTKSVTLENPAENINVWLTADKPQGTAIDVFYSTGGTIKRYVEIESGVQTYTDGFTLVHADDFEKQYVHFYISDSVAYTVPDAGAKYGATDAYGSRGYANRDRDCGVLNQRRMYIVNVDDVSTIQYGGWMCKEDLRSSVDWDGVTSYIEGSIVKHVSGNFYKCIADNSGVEPTVTSFWRTYWEKVILVRVQSSVNGTSIAGDKGLISEDKVNWQPMEPVVSSSFKQAQQAASTTGGEIVTSGFTEYEYTTADKIEDSFTVFSVKVVMKASNPAKIALVRNFRAVASI